VREGRTGKSWVEVYTGFPDSSDSFSEDADLWLPVYPENPQYTFDRSFANELNEDRITVITAGDAFGREQVTANYTSVGGASPTFERNGEKVENFEHFSINAWYDGHWVPVDDLQWYPEGTGAEADTSMLAGSEEVGDAQVYLLGAGDYRLVCGNRYPGGHVHVQTQDFSIAAGQITSLHVDMTPPADLPLTALVERKVNTSLLPEEHTTLATGIRVVLVSDDSEPSLRARNILVDTVSAHGIAIVEYPLSQLQTAEGEEKNPLAAALSVNNNDEMPIVILLVDGATKLYTVGYNLSVGQWLERALEEVGE
jgi:hypothetical protein